MFGVAYGHKPHERGALRATVGESRSFILEVLTTSPLCADDRLSISHIPFSQVSPLFCHKGRAWCSTSIGKSTSVLPALFPLRRSIPAPKKPEGILRKWLPFRRKSSRSHSTKIQLHFTPLDSEKLNRSPVATTMANSISFTTEIPNFTRGNRSLC
jgi:hypothetical protein